VVRVGEKCEQGRVASIKGTGGAGQEGGNKGVNCRIAGGGGGWGGGGLDVIGRGGGGGGHVD